MSEADYERRLKPFLWFTLFGLMGAGGYSRPIKISTTKLSETLGCSQQSASRHLKLLEQLGLVSRRTNADGSLLRITEDGARALKDVLYELKSHLEGIEPETLVFEGTVFSGLFEGAYYISREGYRGQIRQKLGFEPYPGTLNVRLKDSAVERRRRLELMPAVILEGFKDEERSFGSARCYPLVINDEVEGALITAERTTYDLRVIEVVSPVYLRKRLGLKDGDVVRLAISSPPRSSS